jgi:hypothetical protein
MVFAASVVLLAVATLMFLGWGSAFRRLLRVEPANWPATVAIGMAAVVFVGGILNLARIAYPMALAAVAGIGVLLALRAAVSFSRPPLILSLLIAIVMIFTLATQGAPSIYNFHDDYQKYFAYPMRMVETGTVFGSPLSAIGLQTLGAQAFLDGFVVSFFPIRYINGVDAVFGFFLCLILATQFAKNQLLCVLSVVFINPQYVNISTLFCGSALIMATVAVEDSASLGLLYAALIAMKPIFGVFVAIHLLTIAAGGIRAAIRTGLTTVVFLSPWVLVHAPHYLAALRLHHAMPTPVPGDIDTERINLFSLEPLSYGSTAANYTLLVIAIAICGVICWRLKAPLKAVACCITGVTTFPIFVYVFGPMNYGYEHALRYYVPVAIGLTPAVFGLTALAANRVRWLLPIVAIVPLGAFAPSLYARVVAALSTHSAASYSWLTRDAEYTEYNRKVLTGPEQQAVKALQEKIPPGVPILAWINTPFYLDYKRNRIIDIDTAGIAVPWAELPPARYLIWDYAGYATLDKDDYEERCLTAGANERKDSLMTLDFIRTLNSVAEDGEVLFDDGKIKVVRFVGPPILAAAVLSGGSD